MARSPTVPHVPSSSVKVAVPSDVMERVDAVAERAGLTRDDCVELGLRALLDGEESPAAVVWSRYTRGQVQTPADVIAGRDPQLEKAIEIVMKELAANPPKIEKRPAFPVRVQR